MIALLDFVLFMLFSSIEYLAGMFFAFTLFRIRTHTFKYHMVFIAIALSYVSFMNRHMGWTEISPTIQLIVMSVLIWLMFRLQIFWSLVIVSTAYFAYGLVQFGLALSLHQFGWVHLDQIQPFTATGYLIQVGSVALIMIISLLIHKSGFGFDFVPHSEFAKVPFKKENKMILLIIIVSVILTSIGFYAINLDKIVQGFHFMLVCNMIVIYLILYFARKKDKRENELDE